MLKYNIVPPTPTSPKRIFPSCCYTYNSNLSHTYYTFQPSHPPSFNHSNIIWRREIINTLSLHCLSGPNIFFSTMFPNNCNLRVFLATSLATGRLCCVVAALTAAPKSHFIDRLEKAVQSLELISRLPRHSLFYITS
jgi:hypothetical protein